MSKRLSAAAMLAVAAASWGCDPGGITEAEQQLARGGERVIQFTLPAFAETLVVDSILDDLTDDVQFDVLPGGLLSYAVEPETLTVGVGADLRFEDLGFDEFVFGFDQMLVTAEVGTSTWITVAPAAGGPATASPWLAPGDVIRFATEDGSSIGSATIDTGTVVGTIVNGTTCASDVTVTLLDAVGGTVAVLGPVTVGAGATVLDSADVDGVTVNDYVSLGVAGTPQGGCTPNPGDRIDADITFRPLTLSQVTFTNVNETFTETYDALLSEPDLRAVDTVIVETGSFTVTAQNKLPIPLALSISLAGTRTPGGSPVSGTLTVPAAPGDGTTRSAQVTLNLDGATIAPGDLWATVDGVVTAGTASITSAVAPAAVVVDASGALVAGELRGLLDPTKTVELNVDVEASSSIDPSTIDLGDLEDVVRDAELNTVNLELVVDNPADVAVVLQDFRIGVVQIDPGTGQPARDPGTGAYAWETDDLGQPLVVDTSITIARLGETTVALTNQATVDFVNRLVNLVLDDVEVAVVGTGTAVVGDGTRASVTSGAVVSVRVNLSFGIDFTVPAAGVSFDNTTVQGGLEIDSALGVGNGDELAALIDSAAIVVRVQNATPFALQAVIALIADSVEGDVASMPGAIVLAPVSVAAPAVDAAGFVVTPTDEEVSLALTGQQLKVFFGEKFTASLTITLRPPAGGRGALRGSDQVIADGRVSVRLRTGGGQ